MVYYIIFFIVGTLFGSFATGLLAGGSQMEREEIAYRCGYEQGKLDAQNNMENNIEEEVY